MWKTIYDGSGDIVRGGWATFREQITGEHQPIAKIELLNANLMPVGSTINYGCSCGVDPTKGEIQNIVSDGNIDVDTTRGTRRTAELTILNPTAAFTPTTADFESEGWWTGQLYLNRFIRIWKGVHVGNQHLFVPVGTFMVDTVEVIVEQNMSLVNLTLSDFWKKLTKSYAGANIKYDDGTYYNVIIKSMITAAGIDITGKFAAVLDRMPQRTNAEKQINGPKKIAIGESRGEILKKWGKAWGIDMYFDPMGIFRSEDRKSTYDRAVTWTFSSRNVDLLDKNTGLLSLKRTFNDDNLYNHVIIIGTGNEKQTFKAVKKDTNPKSKTNVDTIGDRVFLLETDKVHNQAQADHALRNAWQKRFQLSESITAEVICNPCLEGDDKVHVAEREFAKVEDNYRLRRFNIPLVTSRQTIEVSNIIRTDDI